MLVQAALDGGSRFPFSSLSSPSLTHRLKVKGWKKIFHANRNDKKAGLAIFISDKIDFKTKATKKEKEGHYIMIKGSIQGEDITPINIYAPNVGAPKYIKQILTDIREK